MAVNGTYWTFSLDEPGSLSGDVEEGSSVQPMTSLTTSPDVERKAYTLEESSGRPWTLILKRALRFLANRNDSSFFSILSKPCRCPLLAGTNFPMTPWPRLACLLCLQAKYGTVLLVLGTVCSSWVAVNAGTSGRTLATPDGCSECASVLAANKMVSRTCVCVCVCVHCIMPQAGTCIHAVLQN